MGEFPATDSRLRALLEDGDGIDSLLIPTIRGTYNNGHLTPRRSDMFPEVFIGDQNDWIAKSTGRSRHKVCAEFVAALLARRLRLFTPAFGVIEHAGHAWFASHALTHYQTLLDAEAWKATSGSADFARLYAFDWLIENRDRANRQNTLVVELEGSRRLVTIDHSHSGLAAFNTPAGRGIMVASADFGESQDRDFVRRAIQHMNVIEETCAVAASIPKGVYMRIVELAHLAVGADVFGGLGEVLHLRALGMMTAIQGKWVR